MFFYEYGTVLLSTMSLSQLCLCSQDMSSPMTAVTTQTSATTGDFPSGLMCWVNQVDPHILCILAFFFVNSSWVAKSWVSVSVISRTGYSQIQRCTFTCFISTQNDNFGSITHSFWTKPNMIWSCISWVIPTSCLASQLLWFHQERGENPWNCWGKPQQLLIIAGEDLQQFHLLWHRGFSAIPGMFYGWQRLWTNGRMFSKSSCRCEIVFLLGSWKSWKCRQSVAFHTLSPPFFWNLT